jgi:hypothetical protein
MTAEASIEIYKVTPCLDLELLLVNSEMTSIEGKTAEKLMKKWAEWMPFLHARRLELDNKAYLAVWLDADIETAVDKAFASSPSEGFLLNSLAQTLCMGAVCDIVPCVTATGCAALPEFTEALRAVLARLGLCRVSGSLTLTRRYAVVTHFAFAPEHIGCAECSLIEQCPRAKDM